MNNKLFLICPASHIEVFIRERYGPDVYFLTAPGAVFNFEEIKYTESVRYFLERKAIREVFIVNDTSCRFINTILQNGKGHKTQAEQVMLNLFINNYSQIMTAASLEERKVILATLNLQRQALDILSNEILLPLIKQSQIKVTGVLTTKEKGWLDEVKVQLQKNHN